MDYFNAAGAGSFGEIDGTGHLSEVTGVGRGDVCKLMKTIILGFEEGQSDLVEVFWTLKRQYV